MVSGCFWMIAKLMSLNLWLANRVFPIVPIFSFLDNVPNAIHLFLLVIAVVLLLLIIVKPHKHQILLAIVIVEVLSCLLDQNRWQPWQYQYICMFFVIWYNRKKETVSLLLLIIIFSSTYFYSGLQKINPHFIKLMWQSAILKKTLHLPLHLLYNKNLLHIGYAIPVVEMALGIGLLFIKTRKPAIILIILMHILLLIFIGPFGINYNKIVWPWNVAMIIFSIILWKNKTSIYHLKNIQLNANYIVLLAWIFLPILNIWGYWDSYFSSSLYTGKNKMCYIKIYNPPPNFELKKYYQNIKVYNDTTIATIALHKWAMGEMGTPPCPQERVFKKIKTKFTQQFPQLKVSFFMLDKSTKQKKMIPL